MNDILTGIVLGIFVVSIATIGQGIWEYGRAIGAMTCVGEQPHD